MLFIWNPLTVINSLWFRLGEIKIINIIVNNDININSQLTLVNTKILVKIKKIIFNINSGAP